MPLVKYSAITLVGAALWSTIVHAEATSSPPPKPLVAIRTIKNDKGENLADMTAKVSEAIAATGRFTVSERRNLDTLIDEQILAKSGVVTTTKPGKVGGFEGVDYIINGSMGYISSRPASDFGSALAASLLTGGNSSNCSSYIVTMPLSLQILDSDSGVIKYQSRIESYWRSGVTCTGQNLAIDYNALMTDAANRAASMLITAIFPIQVAAVQADGIFVLNYGEGTLKKDQILVVYQQGDEIRDPTTGEVLASEEMRIGMLKVSEVLQRVSKATAMTSFVGPIPAGAIVRAATQDDIKRMKEDNKRTKDESKRKKKE